jgi:DHA1 family bicyclomycin/chloramphenicol resistance-like MFS transporter
MIGPPHPPSGRAYLRTIAILGGLTAMGPLAIDMYLPALPSIARDLGASPALVQASLAAYFIGIALGQAAYGPFSDWAGRKPALYLGLGVFTLSSIACAVTPRVELLIACRFLQALGGCSPLVVPRAIVRDHFDHQAAVRALSALILVMGLAPILAPLIGGQLLVRWGWRAIFWLLAGYGVVSVAVVGLALPESLPVASRRAQPPAQVLATYRRLLGDRAYMGWVLSGGMIFAGLLAYISGSPFVFIELFGVRPDHFGFFFGANAVGLIAASQVSARLATRYSPRHVVSVVMPVAALSGVALLVAAVTGFGGLAGIVLPLFCFVACHGFTMPNTTALAMSPHGAVAGSASALLGTLQFSMGAACGALVGLLGNGTAVPFGGVIAACSVGGWLTLVTLARQRPTATTPAEATR